MVLLKRIEEWCNENKVSISALEKACGLGNATIRNWETAKPRIDTLQKVSRITGISIDELLAGAEKEGI